MYKIYMQKYIWKLEASSFTVLLENHIITIIFEIRSYKFLNFVFLLRGGNDLLFRAWCN